MRQRMMSFSLLFPFLAAICYAQSSGPDDRQITDPKSIESASNSAARPIPIDDLYFTRSVSNASWSPDGNELVFTTDITGRSNLWKVSSRGGWPIQLAQSDERQYGEIWSPDGKWIVFQQDTGGNELWDIFAIRSDGGDVINLTNTPDIREESPLWSPDGKTIALNHKPKEATVYNIALLDWATRKVTLLTHERTPNHLWQSVAWSPDGKTLYANRQEVSFTDADIYAIDVTGGKTTNLTAHEGSVLNLASSLSKDGKTLLITSNQKGGYRNIALLDIDTKKLSWVTDTKWEATSGDFSSDGKHFNYVINANGRTDVFLGDAATAKSEKVSIPEGVNGPAGYPSSFSPSGDRLLFSHESSVQPGDYWIYDLASRKPTQLTFSATASLSSAPRAPSRIVSYKSSDGKTISALLWIPFNLKRDASNPALVLPHGGPTGQRVDYWSPEVQALVSRGYICIAPNPRGSTGYGLDFQKANFQDLGGGDLKDEIAGVDFLKATGFVDSKKIGIYGGSYGGFMTLMAIGKTPDIWGAAVDQYGIISWLTMLKSSDPSLNEYLKGLLGNPEQNPKVYEDDSPITYIRSEKAPLLVLQGDNDPRVPKEEAQQVVDILKKVGRTVEVHYYPNEGHGFVKRENQIDSIRRTIAWFDQYLMGKTPAP